MEDPFDLPLIGVLLNAALTHLFYVPPFEVFLYDLSNQFADM